MARVLDKRVVNPGLDVACDSGSSVETETGSFSRERSSRRYTTTRFGVIDVNADLVITFPYGLIGFESCREYVVVRHDDNSPFRWLQSLDEASLAFPIVEPVLFRPDYAPTISNNDARSLSLRSDSPTLLFAVVSVPGQDPRAMTANLLAPLVINGDLRQGKQVIVQDEGYSTRHEVVKELERAATLPAAPVAVTNLPNRANTASGSTKTVRAA